MGGRERVDIAVRLNAISLTRGGSDFPSPPQFVRERMAEALVSVVLESFVSTIVDDLTSMAKEEMRLFVDAPKELDKISRKFRNIQEVIADAERKQANEKRVRDWLAELKDLAYDIDDIVDEWKTEALRSEIEQRIVTETRNKPQVCNFFSPCFCFNRNVLRYKTGHRIKDIKERLNGILQEMSELNFVRNAVSVGSSASVQVIKERQTTSLLRESEVIFGRDEDRDKMVDLLLNESSQQKEKVITISIVGMGGLGKTTLAQLVYADERVEKHFEKRIWVCVSDDFDLIRLTKAMIEDATKQKADLTELQPCQSQLREILGGKRFLIVLDDVWNEVGKKWDDLMVPLTFGAKGSRIVVTTRSEKVARIMHSNHTHNLEILSEDDCWSLFSHMAFYGRVESDEFSGLEEIGKEILKKCKGLPLAAKTLGSVMNTKKTRQEWEDVKESEIWDLEDVEKGIVPALLLSYQDLPSDLRQCFTYCSIFPKDFVINKEKLVHMWMAQGFLKPKRGMDMEEVGNSYCDELLWRSLFQVSEKSDLDDTIISYTMHDLVSDMTRMIAGKECAFIEIGKPTDLTKAHHLFLDDANSIPNTFFNIGNHLRTIMYVGVTQSIFEVPQNLFPYSRSLRVLDLSKTSLSELPVSIENLKHLRYLDLSFTDIEKLPKSVSTLCNMSVLRLDYCFKLKKLPDEMGKMIGLRHLLVQKCRKLNEFPDGIGRLSCLKTLHFYVGDDRCRIGEIKSLEFLCKLHIYHLERVKNVDDTKEAELKEKKHLRELNLEWDDNNAEDSCEMERQLDVLEGLRPYTNLTMLTISYYCGRNFPSWIGNQLFCNLTSVKIMHCNNCQILPPFGQLPSLKYLMLGGMRRVKNVGREFYGSGGVRGFPKLLKLSIFEFVELEEWDLRIGGGEMPCLLYNYIGYCPELKRLPQLPLTLKTLYIADCRLLKEQCKVGGEDWHKISHVPNIINKDLIQEKIQISLLIHRSALSFIKSHKERL